MSALVCAGLFTTIITGGGGNPALTDPESGSDYYNYMSGFWLDNNAQCCYGGNGHPSRWMVEIQVGTDRWLYVPWEILTHVVGELVVLLKQLGVNSLLIMFHSIGGLCNLLAHSLWSLAR
jgi:hypothetical protein